MAITAETFFRDFRNKNDIKTTIHGLPLGPTSDTRRVESLSEDVDRQVLKDLWLCEYLFDEPLDVMDTAQLVVFVRMAFQDFTTKEDFLTLLHLKERTRGKDIYNEFKKNVSENDIPIHKLIAITIDGALAMPGERRQCCNDFPDFMNYHCMIHQQALAGKVVDFPHIIW